MINGTQLITSLGAEAVEMSSYIGRQADIIAGMTLEVLKGTTRAFDPDIQKIRPHPGQAEVAKRIRAILNSSIFPSQIADSHRFCKSVQDAYTLRCCPQVHGVVHDTINFVKGIITTEMNSATDNPLVFVERSEIISSGNFHGEYPAKALDYLAIAIHELGSMSERRIERLVNPAQSGLPAFLVQNGGLNSGFMIAHCTAAALGIYYIIEHSRTNKNICLNCLVTLQCRRTKYFVIQHQWIHFPHQRAKKITFRWEASQRVKYCK